MLINESIVFPPAGAAAPRWCRFRFRRPFFMCVSRLFFRQRGRIAALWICGSGCEAPEYNDFNFL